MDGTNERWRETRRGMYTAGSLKSTDFGKDGRFELMLSRLASVRQGFRQAASRSACFGEGSR